MMITANIIKGKREELKNNIKVKRPVCFIPVFFYLNFYSKQTNKGDFYFRFEKPKFTILVF
jgi:hypothetical protein